jgi:capsular exopolysaccharide synthesis family protein
MIDIYNLARRHSKQPYVRDSFGLLDEWFAVLKRRRKVFFMTLGVLGVLLFGFLILMAKSYTTEASVIVGSDRQPDSGDAPTSLPILNALMVVSGIQSGETYAELMTEAPVAQSVIAKLGLKTTPKMLLSHVKAEPVNNTSIIRISATWSDPKTSARIANAFAQSFLDRERSLVVNQADTAANFLATELPAAGHRQNEAERALTLFQKRHQVADMNTQAQATIAALAALDVKSGQLSLDRRQAQAELRSDAAQSQTVVATTTGGQSVAPNPVVQQLQTQLANVQAQLGEAERAYTDRHPTVIALKRQRNQLQREITQEPATIVSASSSVPNPTYQQLVQQSAGYRTQIASDDAGLAETASQRRALLRQIRQLPDVTLALATLERNAKQAEAVYGALQQRLNDAMIARSTAISDATITAAALPEDAVSRPSRALVLMVGVLISLIIAVTVVAVLEYLDRRSRTEEEIHAAFGRHVLGVLPDLSNADEQSLPWLRTMALESILKLVRSVWLTGRPNIRSVAFTSRGVGDGKTTLAINTAWTLAEMKERVLLIDADLRRPTLHKLLNVPNELGFSDVLSGTASFGDCIRSGWIRGLDLLTSGTPSVAPGRLLQAADFDALLTEAENRGYQRIIVDLPAVLPVVDAATIAGKLDATIIVLSADRTDARSAGDVVSYVENLGIRNVVGMVINRVRRDDTEAKYYASVDEAPLALR